MGKISFNKIPGQGNDELHLEGEDVVPELFFNCHRGPDGSIKKGPNEVPFSCSAKVREGGALVLLRVRAGSIGGEWKIDRPSQEEWPAVTVELDRDAWAVRYEIDRFLVDNASLSWQGSTDSLTEMLSGRCYSGARSISGNNPIAFDFSDDRPDKEAS